ncbi:Zinc finger protein BRUTUS [Sesamum angolense]|uniref:Zinc finger protein BRUTUS n=1 Tax=Sesamum angolense TaxID=2727404 RepID=A0AAE1XD73_9LAMI|nr:Zinc finger protein BRUTUS [Sesamum angolense]
MATPGIQNGGVTVMAAEPVVTPVDQNGHSAAALRLSSPIRIFLFFHKAIRTELDGLHRTALALATNTSGGDIKQLMEKCHFLRSIYKHHCNAEDEVIFPALDIRVKNVARTYSLEHEGESVLFDQLFTLLRSDMKNEESYRESCLLYWSTSNINQSAHVQGKEQVFPLLREKFSFEEQASLVWQFLCSIPVNMMAEFLPWLSSSISADERQDMRKCLQRIIPDERLLQQVIFNWMDGLRMSNKRKRYEDGPRLSSTTENGHCSCEFSRSAQSDLPLSDCNATSSSLYHPVDDILHWHKAIEKELNDIAEAARNIKLTGDFSDLSAFNKRLQFIAEVCIFHSIAEDKVIFPAVDGQMSFVQEHAEEESEFDKFRCLIESIESAGANSSAEFYSELCSQADHIMETIKKHFLNEEIQVLPLARKHFSAERQRELLYQSLCVMPLRLIECVLPWLVGSLSEEEARGFLYNLHVAAPASDTALVTLFSAGHAKVVEECVCLLVQLAVVLQRNPKKCMLADIVVTARVQVLLMRVRHLDKHIRVNSNNLGMTSLAVAKSLRSLSFGPSAPSLNSSLFSWETDNSSSISGLTTRPIDNIFKFHKAIRKDLEFLDVESGKLGDCDETFLRQFSDELSQLHENLSAKNVAGNLGESSSGSLTSVDCLRKYNELATKIQGMCKSIKVTLDHHVMREEVELWPLFDRHFSVEEQDKIVGRIIGTTGAEVLQSMLPWVTSALTQEEQNKMMDTWKNATKNTMFSEWLNEWWEGTPAASTHVSTSENSISQVRNVHQFDSLMLHKRYVPFSEIRKVSRDSTLDPRRKAYLIQNLMTSRWIASQQKYSQSRTGKADEGEDLLGRSPSFRDPEKKIFGCEHYKRNCKLRAACCGKLFACRFCHDEVSDHSMDRKATSEMMCMNCLQIQPVGPVCSTPSCNGLPMAKYYCSSCKFFDDEREVYHCPFCNLCRVGKGLGIDFFHCMTCNCCLAMKLSVHKCWEKGLETNCPICCDFLFTSSTAVRALPCGHYMHSACFQAYACTHYICPICSKSMGDMSVYFGMLDGLMASEVLPEEYRNRCQDILCNDCDRKGTAPFHWLYHKCGFCGSYNTRVIKVDQDHDCS